MLDGGGDTEEAGCRNLNEVILVEVVGSLFPHLGLLRFLYLSWSGDVLLIGHLTVVGLIGSLVEHFGDQRHIEVG